MGTTRVQFENAFHEWSAGLIDINRASNGIVAIAERSASWIDTLLCLFAHAFLNFFFQVLHIVLCNRYVDIVHELVLRAGILPDHPRLLDEMNFCSALFDQSFERERIGAIAIQPIRFLDEDNTTC